MRSIGWRLRGGGSRIALAVGILAGGCSSGKRVDTTRLVNTRFAAQSIAVAPAINQSGSRDFDPNRFADWMAVELGHAENVTVIPVSRALAVLTTQGLDGVRSASHAEELAGALGADAILVFAVTHYDPYHPPSIGITAQLYGARPGPGEGMPDSSNDHAVSKASGRPSGEPLARTQRIFDAAHESVVADLKEFARTRDADGSPYGWRKYVVSQQHFIRYCCHATIRALLSGSGEVLPVPSEEKR